MDEMCKIKEEYDREIATINIVDIEECIIRIKCIKQKYLDRIEKLKTFNLDIS